MKDREKWTVFIQHLHQQMEIQTVNVGREMMMMMTDE